MRGASTTLRILRLLYQWERSAGVAWRESRPYCCGYVLAAGKLPLTSHYTEWTIGTVPLCYPLGQILLAGHYRAGLRHKVYVSLLLILLSPI